MAMRSNFFCGARIDRFEKWIIKFGLSGQNFNFTRAGLPKQAEFQPNQTFHKAA